MNFITVHLLRSLPMHNLNRDQNGLPKSQFDGGAQRARLSSQSIKRPARIALRESISESRSIRTREAAKVVGKLADRYATDHSLGYDAQEGLKAARAVIASLAKAEKADTSSDTDESGDNILLFSDSELDTLARAIVDAQQDGKTVNEGFILDHRSASLDIAAFGRMFANRADLSTQAAVAVSHAVTTHPMTLTIDYFTAVDDLAQQHPELVERNADGSPKGGAGAGHIGQTYYTSGVYYSTFTIDAAQLRRSWSGIDGDTAATQIEALVKALVGALPTGRMTNSNAHTLPFLVVAETQRAPFVYEFETPVQPGRDGGYKQNSAAELARQQQMMCHYDHDLTGDTVWWGDPFDAPIIGTQVKSITKLARFVAEQVLLGAKR